MTSKNPSDPANLPDATEGEESTLLGGPSPFAPRPAAPITGSNRPVPVYGRPIQVRPAAPGAMPERTQEGADSTMRGTPAFTEPPAAPPMEESNQTVMQQSPFIPVSAAPSPFANAAKQMGGDLSEIPTAVKPTGLPAAGTPKRATGSRPAITLPEQPPAMEESSSTMIFDPKKQAQRQAEAAAAAAAIAAAAAAPPAEESADATVMLSGPTAGAMASAAPPASAAPEPSAELAGNADDPTEDPRARRAGPVRSMLRPPPSAPAAAVATSDEPEHTVNIPSAGGAPTVPAKSAGPRAFILLIMATFAIAIGAKLLKGDPLPSDTDLRIAYPYASGGRLPNGHTAPGAMEVEFAHEKAVECHGQMCHLYKVTGLNGGFEMQMLVYPEDGIWKLDPSGSQNP